MSGVVKKVSDVAFKASKTIDWGGMAKMIVTDEAKKEFSSLRRAFKEVNSTLQTKFSQASGPFLQHGMRFSTSVPSDPDTHDDFKPKNKLDNSEITLKDIVKQDIKDNHVMIYMKGDPEQPRCGFSSLAVRVLSEYRVPIHSRNILEDPELKNAVKDFSTWPTFPQIFINGEFIGGSDIILNMHQNGELKEKLKNAAENYVRWTFGERQLIPSLFMNGGSATNSIKTATTEIITPLAKRNYYTIGKARVDVKLRNL